MMEKHLKKLDNSRGETLVEVLVSLLIICIAMLMLTTAIAAGARSIRKAKEAVNDYYIRNNILTVGDEESGTAGNVTISRNLTIGSTTSIKVKFYENDVFKQTKVIAYIEDGE